MKKFLSILLALSGILFACARMEQPAVPEQEEEPEPDPPARTLPDSVRIFIGQDVELSLGTSQTIYFKVLPAEATFDFSEGSTELRLKCGPDSLFRMKNVEMFRDTIYKAVIEDASRSVKYDRQAEIEVLGVSSPPFNVKSKYLDKEHPGAKVSKSLPTAFLNTDGRKPIDSKDYWLKKSKLLIINPDYTIDHIGEMQVKGRGNTTWYYPKKPYALKFDEKTKLLGMPKGKRWCLLANWMDRTQMRNAVAFAIAAKTGLSWTPRGKFIVLYLNNRYNGNYYLCEQIRIGKNRVNVNEDDKDADDRGYIFEIDVAYDEQYKFHSNHDGLPWMFKDPDEVSQSQLNWVRNYVNEMERSLYEAESFQNCEFENYMDLESFADWWITTELTGNGESWHPKSVYMHKDTGGRMTAGPVWDFDWGTFTSGSGYSARYTLYYNRLFGSRKFREIVKQRWDELKPSLETDIPVQIDSLYDLLRHSDTENITKWPISSDVNGDEKLEFKPAVDRLKEIYLKRLNWLDSMIR